MSAHRQRRSGFTHRLAGRFVSAAVALSTIALACAVSHLIALPTSKIRQVSYEFITTAAIDTSSTAVGVADSDLYAMSPSDVAVTLDTLQALGVNQVRILVPWALVEAYEGNTTGPKSTRLSTRPPTAGWRFWRRSPARRTGPAAVC